MADSERLHPKLSQSPGPPGFLLSSLFLAHLGPLATQVLPGHRAIAVTKGLGRPARGSGRSFALPLNSSQRQTPSQGEWEPEPGSEAGPDWEGKVEGGGGQGERREKLRVDALPGSQQVHTQWAHGALLPAHLPQQLPQGPARDCPPPLPPPAPSQPSPQAGLPCSPPEDPGKDNRALPMQGPDTRLSVSGECGCRCFRLPLSSPTLSPSHPAASPGLPSCSAPRTSCPQDRGLHSQAHCLWPPSPCLCWLEAPGPSTRPRENCQSRASGEKGEGAVPWTVDRPHPLPPCGSVTRFSSLPQLAVPRRAPSGTQRALGPAAILCLFFTNDTANCVPLLLT